MRIEFLNAAREDFHWAQAQLRIGSASDNDLVLAASQTAPLHLRIDQDRRGWVLQVLPPAGRVYVNARPVRERALLRAGDVVSLGDCRMLLRDDDDPASRLPRQVPAQERCTVALRSVGGPLSGRILPVSDGLTLGPGGCCSLGLAQGEQVGLRVDWEDGRLMLESTCPSNCHALRVNGVAVQRAALQGGDQISLAMHRFVLEAPGKDPDPESIESAPSSAGLPEATAGPTGEVWWLIVTAAVLALAIALVLLVRF
ncbi:MAG: FHA domain-containing protein [Rhodanobacter sp.]